MSNEQCKSCLIYETMPNRSEIKHMTAYCGLSKHSLCPCFHCLVKVMCHDACKRFSEWRVGHPPSYITEHMGRFYS
jgi:hypothetical protein